MIKAANRSASGPISRHAQVSTHLRQDAGEHRLLFGIDRAKRDLGIFGIPPTEGVNVALATGMINYIC